MIPPTASRRPERSTAPAAWPLEARATVVHIITQLELGGAQQNTLATCARLDRARFRPLLVYGPGGMLDAEAERLGVPRWPVDELVRPVLPGKDTRAVRRLTSLLRVARAEHRALGLDPRRFIVHTHSSKAGIVGRLAAVAARVPVIIHGIHGFGFHQGQNPVMFAFFLNAERMVARVTNAFFSVSAASLAEARRRGIVSPAHFTRVIRSGMDLDAFRSTPARRAAVRAALGLADDAQIVLTIANFKPQKDPLTLVRAFAPVARRHPRAVLLFAGDGPLRPQVEAAVAGARLQTQVRLLGWHADIGGLLAACDIVALSSIFEGLPRSAVQAVAARRPFVGTNVDGTPEIIRDGKNGYLVPPRDSSALADAIERALAVRPIDPEDERRVRAWDVARMIEDQEAAYTALVSA